VAGGGTFFLDEVGDTSLGIQVKLLRVLEEKCITPVGETEPINVDVRLIAATNTDLEKAVKAGQFRADLFYRLNVIPIQIPPLRERREDIPVLVDHFVARFCQKTEAPLKQVSENLMEMLLKYDWPGNVRELENVIERAVLLNRSDNLDESDFPDRLVQPGQARIVTEEEPKTPTLASIERAYIHFVMSQTDGKKSEAARILGIDASTLYRKIRRYNLDGDEIVSRRDTDRVTSE